MNVSWTIYPQHELVAILNPLSANVACTRNDTLITSDSCGHSEYYEMNFYKKKFLFSNFLQYTKRRNLVDPLLRNCVTKSKFDICFKKRLQNGIQNLVFWLIRS